MALKDITLGQYFPGNSLLHRLDPRTKILAVVLYIVALFLAKHFFTYAIMFCVLALSISLSHVPLKSLFRGMKPVVFILIFTAVLNLFYTPGEHVLFHFWILTVTMEGVVNASFMVIRILMLIAGTFLLTYTTSPILLTDGLESLLGPLKKIKVPVHELSMMMSIALRFIPTLIEETDKIMSAQRARGADFATTAARAAPACASCAMPPVTGPCWPSSWRWLFWYGCLAASASKSASTPVSP